MKRKETESVCTLLEEAILIRKATRTSGGIKTKYLLNSCFLLYLKPKFSRGKVTNFKDSVKAESLKN